MVYVCPRCNQRFSSASTNTDVIHKCNSGNKSLDQEDKVVIGDWEDYTGSGKVHSTEALLGGAGNELLGTKAGLEGEDFDGVTARGARKPTHRQRQHLEFINLK